MAKVLVIHRDAALRTVLVNAAGLKHEVAAARDLVSGVQYMAKARPHVVIVGHDKDKQDGLRLMKYMRDHVLKTPVVIVFAKGGGTSADHQTLIKLGAKGFVESPVDPERLEHAIQHAIQARAALDAAPPPITSDELSGNLTMIEKDLNKKMKCFAGRNQVYIQSKILGARTSKPRIALKCSLRAEYGLNKDVYYEWVKDVCCGNPAKCEAYQQFMENRDL